MTEPTTTAEDPAEVGALRREDLSPDTAYEIAVQLATAGVSNQALLTLVDAHQIAAVREAAGLSDEELGAA